VRTGAPREFANNPRKQISDAPFVNAPGDQMNYDAEADQIFDASGKQGTVSNESAGPVKLAGRSQGIHILEGNLKASKSIRCDNLPRWTCR
jgi:hypothetical protein